METVALAGLCLICENVMAFQRWEGSFTKKVQLLANTWTPSVP